MCQSGCQTCFGNKFYQCLSCSNAQFILKNSHCIKQPVFLVQIVCTFLLILFILPNLMRKRCLTLMRIFDAIQTVAYFKYINRYIQNRHNYLYLGMRAWGEWSEGWNLISSNSYLPIWYFQEAGINKIIRISIIWIGILAIMLIMGLLKTMMGDSQITLSAYIEKNLPITLTLGFYINVQDMSLVMANSYNSALASSPFSNASIMIQLGVSIVFGIIFIAMILWMSYRINYDYSKHLQKTPKKIYPHVYLFMMALDYDIFQTYQLTSLPVKQKKINRFSNVRLIQIFKKAAYAFLMVGSLYTNQQSLSGQIFSILGLLIFFNIIWYVSMPYDFKTQKIQLILGVLADILVIVILVLPLMISSQIIQMILCLSLFGLAIISLVLEFYLDVYKIIPVDLYETGLSVVIEDKKLLKEIEERKRLQEQHEKMMKQIQEQNRKLRQELQAQKTNKQRLKDDTQQSLPNLNQKDDPRKLSEQMVDDKNINENMLYQGNQEMHEKTSMNSDDLVELYKIDEQKRRKIYQFNKKTNFTYSNKVQT